MGKIDKAVEWAINIANDDTHGYDQGSRWSPDYDCASLLIQAWENAGVPVKTAGATYTGNMVDIFLANGFTEVTSSVNLSTGAGMKKGDVCWYRSNGAGHTEMITAPGYLVGAHINELGSATGGQTGDQTGNEISVTNYYNHPWMKVLRYTADDSGETPTVQPTKMSDKGIALLKQFEGLSLTAYKGDGETYWTIGYGHYGADVYEGMVITEQEAEDLLRSDIVEFEQYTVTIALSKFPTLNQHQFDALVSYCYNRGPGKTDGSNGLRQLIFNSDSISEISDNFLVYWGTNTNYYEGLMNRRRKEQELFNTPVSGDTPTPDPEPEEPEPEYPEYKGTNKQLPLLMMFMAVNK